MKSTVTLYLLPLLASQLCLVEGIRDRHRARIGLRRHRHLEDKHIDDVTHKTDIGREVFDEDDGVELLVGAENGRYKVVAKAEPYKNLPPAPVTPETDYFAVTPGPNERKYKPTPKPNEELKFALLNDAKTQTYVPARQTPSYQPTTPTYSVTPPAIEFEPTPAELKGKKSKTKSKAQHGRFKISVDDEDVNNLQPTPPPTTTPPPPTKASKHHQSQHRPKRPKPTPVAKLKSNSVKQKKNKDYSGYFVSQNTGREDDLITNEIQSGSLEKNKVQIVSTSIYDPRPKSRSYKNNYNAAYKRGRKSKKYNYRNKHNTKNYNLPIRDHKSSRKHKQKSKGKTFKAEVEGYNAEKDDRRQFETVKRQQPALPPKPLEPVAPEPIFLSSHPSPAHVKSLQPLSKPAPARVSPFTAFPASPAPSLVSHLHQPATTVAPPVTPPPPSPTPPLAHFNSPVQHFASFAPVKSLPPPPPSPKPHHSPAPAPLVHHAPAPLVHHTPAPLVHHAPAPVVHHAPAPAPLVHHAPAPVIHHPPPPPPPVHQHEEVYEPSPEEYEPKPYSYNFGVNDVYSGVDYNRAEERSDTGVTRGSYTVKLPDGRIQTVSYVADDNGFHATVSYEGEPAYPEVKEAAHPHPDVHHPPVEIVSEPVYKPSNRYRASNKVAVTPETTFISPTPAPFHPVTLVKEVPHSPPPPPPPPAPAPLIKEAPVPAPVVHEAPIIGPIVKQLPHAPPTPAPTLYTPTTTAGYSPGPVYASPFPNFSPSPSPYFHTTPPPPYFGSPSPLPHFETSTPAPYDVTPAPIFHTTPSLILGLKASHPPDNVHYDVAATHLQHSQHLPHPRHHIPPITTWKPKYPKILEHTLRSAPSETYYGHRIKKGVKDEDRVTKKDDYDEYEY